MRTYSRLAVLARGAVLAVPLVAALASSAYADEGDPRVFGIGSAFGAGVQAAAVVGLGGANAKTGVLPAVDLPTLEFQYFLPRTHGFSIDLSVPLTNVIVVSAVTKSFYFGADAFFNFNLGRGSFRGVVGPGIGFEAFVASSSAGTVSAGGIRIPAEVGFEVLSSERHFGFKLLARPFAEFVPAGGVSAVGGGALLLLDFMGYYTR